MPDYHEKKIQKHSGYLCCIAVMIINHNRNTNTYTNTGGLFRFGYERDY